ncbi:protein FAM81B [Engraulis encrasicolus]|uniref:protein FAM81B n=1 Tax=Engraulis encrasicolus TaxID=184585 RepID=UPI002FD5876E
MRSDVLEGRLVHQERTLSSLLQQALQIKEEVVASLRSTQGSLLAESSSRRLLESHIHTITHIVKQLSADIQVLESQISQRDVVTTGTSLTLQSMDQKNLAGIGDLRGRVARCDASTGKLSEDVSAGSKDILRLQQDMAGMRSQLELGLKDVELKLSQAMTKLESMQAEQQVMQKNTSRDLTMEIQRLEVKASEDVRELQQEVSRMRKWAEHQLQITTQAHTQGSEHLRSIITDKLGEVEGRSTKHLTLLSARLEAVETHLEQQASEDRVGQSETKHKTRLAALERSLRKELDLIKTEYRSGFQSIHDSIDSLKHIGDAKAAMDKEMLQRDIKQIRRKMVGLSDA